MEIVDKDYKMLNMLKDIYDEFFTAAEKTQKTLISAVANPSEREKPSPAYVVYKDITFNTHPTVTPSPYMEYFVINGEDIRFENLLRNQKELELEYRESANYLRKIFNLSFTYDDVLRFFPESYRDMLLYENFVLERIFTHPISFYEDFQKAHVKENDQLRTRLFQKILFAEANA